MGPTVRPRTLASYQYLAKRHLVPHLGRVQLSRLRPEHVQGMEAAMLAAGLSAKTVRNAHFLLHRALAQAVKWHRLSVNVVSLVDPPRAVRVEQQSLSAQSARQLVELVAGTDLEAIVVVALTTGLRQGELLALRWPDVDLDGARLRVSGSMIQLRGEAPRRVEPKSERGRRTVVLTSAAVAALRRHRQAHPSIGLVFPVSASTLQKRWRRVAPGVRFHDLRHTAATLMLQGGVPLPLVAEQLGHDPAVTMRVYAHVTPTMRDQAAAVMDAVLRGP